MNNIVIVCDEKDVSDILKSNLMLLREFDNVYSCDFLTSSITISQNNPQLIVLYSKNVREEVLNFIKTNHLIPVIFITDDLSDEILLSIYDAGAVDFLSTKHSSTEFLVRVMACLKRNVELQQGKQNAEILSQIGIINKNTMFYSSKYTQAIFKNLINVYIKKDVSLTIMALSADVEDKNKYNLEYLATIAKQNLREDDIIGFGENEIYLLLKNTNTQGALNVYNKIKDVLNDSCGLCAGILQIEKSFNLEKIFLNLKESLNDALLLKNSAVVQENYNDTVEMNWLDRPKKHKSFKLFKKALMKKLETVIIPVFYQKQQLAEQRLFEIKVEHYCNDKKSSFALLKGDKKSVLEITYPGLVKANVTIYNNYDDEILTESYELKDVTVKNLGEILDAFIFDFQKQDK